MHDLVNSILKGGKNRMKKLFLVLIMAMFLLGCGGSAKKSEFWEHDTMYRNMDHLKFSWKGYKSPTPKTQKMSQTEDWWGIPID